MDTTLVKDILGKLLTFCDLPFDGITLEQENSNLLRVNIASSIPSRIIGWHGETLNALQHILKSMMRTIEKSEKAPFIVVDTDGYRRMQEEKVMRIAEQKADFVRRTGTRLALAPMSPYFRRIVHLHVANSPVLQDLTTESIGEGDYRQIVLKLKNEKGHVKSGEELSPVISKDDGLENLDI